MAMHRRWRVARRCDRIGARMTFVVLLLVGIPGMILFMTAQGAAAFTIGRIIIGLSLATFVTCQVWCSQFFDRSIVGTVNATAGGWGNLGGGITLLFMPFIMDMFMAATGNNIDTSWRLCMIVPIVMHLVSAGLIFVGTPRAASLTSRNTSRSSPLSSTLRPASYTPQGGLSHASSLRAGCARRACLANALGAARVPVPSQVVTCPMARTRSSRPLAPSRSPRARATSPSSVSPTPTH